MTDDVEQGGFAALLSILPVDDGAKAELSARMGAPYRAYHGKRHLALIWRRHQRYAAPEGLTAPGIETLIACAIAYHDCVYDSRRRDNEARSAEFWMRASERSLLSDEDRKWVADTILATAEHLGYTTSAGESSPAARLRERARIWVLDLDLTPLGCDPAEFDRDTASLRREAPHFSDEEWDARRRSFLRRLSEAPQIFRSPALAAIFEAPARANIARQVNGPF
jgi:predicted metal-dependent HD superfamily phosphohydrolase